MRASEIDARLDADLMIVGHDWGDVDYFRENRGLDKPGNPTNKALMQLLESVGRPVPPPPSLDQGSAADRGTCRVYMTNALLFLKTGGLSAPVRDEWFTGSASDFLREQIEIVRPRVVVALGTKAYDTTAAAYGMPKRRGAFKRIVEESQGKLLPGTVSTLFGVYHCGARIRNTHRRPPEQVKDWERIGRFLSGETLA